MKHNIDSFPHSKTRFDLSTFILLPEITPIFYDETVATDSRLPRNNQIRREYFCLYLDNATNEFKILSYTVDSVRAAGHGIKLRELYDLSVTVNTADDLAELSMSLNATEFSRANIAILQKMVGKHTFKEFFTVSYNILARISSAYKMNNIAKSLTKTTFSMPINNKLITRTDVLGKYRTQPPASDVCLFAEKKVVSFSDINFAEMLSDLVSQYKWRHRALDWLKS